MSPPVDHPAGCLHVHLHLETQFIDRKHETWVPICRGLCVEYHAV